MVSYVNCIISSALLSSKEAISKLLLEYQNTLHVPLHKLLNSGDVHQYRKQQKTGTVGKVAVLSVFTAGNPF